MLGRSATKKINILALLCVSIVNDIYGGKGRASVFVNNYPGGSLGFLRQNGQGEKDVAKQETAFRISRKIQFEM
jgi:hypothetical protein